MMMLTLVVFVCMYLSVYALFRDGRRMEESVMRSGAETVRRVSGMVTENLATLTRILNSTFMSPEVVRKALSPELVRVENMQSVTEALTTATAASDSIDALYLFSARNKIGLSSDYSASGWQVDSWLGVLSRFLTRRDKLTPVVVAGVPVYYYNEGAEIYIVRGFPDVRYEPCSLYFLMHVASDAFGRTVNGSGTEALFCFDAKGTALSGPAETAGGVQPGKIWNTVVADGKTAGNVQLRLPDGKRTRCIYEKNAETGWTLVYLTEPESALSAALYRSHVPEALMWTAFLLFGVCMIGIGAKRLTNPLDRLIENIGGADPEIGDEWAYLSASYERLTMRKEELEHYLPIAAGAIEEDLFRSLLAGEPAERERVAEQLALAGSPFRTETPAAVFLCDVTKDGEAEADTMADTIAYFELNDRVKEVLGERGTPYLLMRSRDAAAALVCALPAEETDACYCELCGLFGALRLSGGAPVWGFGKPANDLLSLTESMEDAKRNLDYFRYHRDDGKQSETSGGYRRSIEFLHDLSQRMHDGAIGDLAAETERVVGDIGASVADAGLRRELYRMLLDTLLSEEPGADGTVTGEQLLPPDLPEEELAQRAAEHAREIAERLGDGLASGQDKRIRRVCRYIETHYADAGLSLEQAAEYVGVSASYLSRSFTAAMQKNFTAYLNEYRVECAKKLLETTELPAQEVGYLTGFCSMATFFRVFKKTTGLTPKQYRTGAGGTEEE